MRQLQVWEKTPFQDIRLSINVSGVQFKDEEFFDYLKNAIADINPSLLDIELTESVLMDNFKEKSGSVLNRFGK